MIEDIAYIVKGQVENIYAILVVLLGYAPYFRRTNHWHGQAQYETDRGEICGFKQTSDDQGKLELVLYYRKDTPDFVRRRFQGLFEEILYTHNVIVREYPPLYCPEYHHLQERRVVIQRMQEGKTFLFCAEDGSRVPLLTATARINISNDGRSAIKRDQTMSNMCTSYESALVRVKGLIRDRRSIDKPTCFVSYAAGNAAHERWVLQLADDLRKADIDVKLVYLSVLIF